MKILFVYPDIQRNLAPQLGICMLSAVAKEEGSECEVIDFHSTPRGEELAAFKEKMSSYEPDILAVSCRTNEWPLVKILFEGMERGRPIRIFGGPHVTAVPDEVLEIADVSVIGEGEETFREILRNARDGRSLDDIRGTHVFKEGKIIRNELRELVSDLDTLPIPDWKIFDDTYYLSSPLSRHFEKGEKIIGTFEGSRGCPFSCAYCNNNFLRKLFKGKGAWRREKSPERIIREIRLFNEIYKAEGLFFLDEVILTNTDRLAKFGKTYRKEIGLPFFFMERPENMTDEKVRLIREAGAIRVHIGIESGDEEMRRNLLNRLHSQETIISAFRTARKYGLRSHAFTMVGFPGEDRDTIFRTLALLKEARPDSVQTTTYYPMRGTDLYDRLVRDGYFNPEHAIMGNFYGESSLNLDKAHKARLFKYQMLLSNYRSRLLYLMVKYDMNESFFGLYRYWQGACNILRTDGFPALTVRIVAKIRSCAGFPKSADRR